MSSFLAHILSSRMRQCHPVKSKSQESSVQELSIKRDAKYLAGRVHSEENFPSDTFQLSIMAGYEGTILSSDVRSGNMIFEPILGNEVFRFDCSADDRRAAFPSLSFVHPKVRETMLANTNQIPTYIPIFECDRGQQTVIIELPAGTSFYGTGEVSGPLERTGKKVVAWNTDSFGYGPDNISLYQSHPWVLAILPNGEALGALADTTRRCEIDLQQESHIKFTAPESYPVITFGPFSSPTEVMMALSQAIGTVFMPPKWSLGYQQSRWSYTPDSRVREIASTFREKNIPCDVIWMDIDYMDGYRCFTFHKKDFPDPQSLANDLHEMGFKGNWMLDPGIKYDPDYFVYQSGTERNIWVQANAKDIRPEAGNVKGILPDEVPFVGNVWPGPCVFPDFTMSEARSWWANLVKDFISNGVDGIWNDMNEPAVFYPTGTDTMPENNIHRGDGELGGREYHSHYHNVYGMLMARSTFEGQKLSDQNKRPFVLTRAAFIGSQKYASTWTGDNRSSWLHLHMSIPMVLNLGLSGQPFSGPDIGGFADNATPELFARWMGVGALFPFCRAHSANETNHHEPWSFGKECEEVCRRALKRRYRLLPQIYTLFYIAHTRGIPVATPTFFADPKDPNLRSQETSFLLGPLLVSASTQPYQLLGTLERKLPKGIWMKFDFEDSHADLPELFLKGGSIIPLGPPHQHVGEAKDTDDLTLLVALDENGKAEGVLFEDDGDGYEYIRGGYLLTTYFAELKASVFTVRILKTRGFRPRPKRRLHVQLLLGNLLKLDMWGTDGETLQIKLPSGSEISNLGPKCGKEFGTCIEDSE